MFLSILISAGMLTADLPSYTAGYIADTLQAVTVTADKGVVISRTDTLHILNSSDVSGELHQIPGLQIGDYGGFAGLKTVSLRGMGSPHTSIYIDGVNVGNVQSGQGDLGMLDIENFTSVVVDYAQNSISFNTSRPVFKYGNVAAEARVSIGSFDTYLPSARVDFRLSDKLALSANAAGIISKGNFNYGEDGVRTNNDITRIRGGLNLFGSMDRGEYHVKAFYNASERGTPGSVSWPSDDRQKDMNAYVQGVLSKQFSELYTLKVSAKAGYDDIYYTSAWGDSEYGQIETQLNTAHLFHINNWWNISFAADIQWDKLTSNIYQASRFTTVSALTTSFRLERLSLNVAAEYSGYFDKDQNTRHAISPSLDFRLRLLDGLDLVGFARRAYRVPMFNELYYVGYGNPELLPEDAWLTDLGIDFYRHISDEWRVKAKADGFYNYLTDKITSAPTEENPDIWLPFNIGKVRSAGFDLVAGTDFHSGYWKASFDARYSYLDAIDATPDNYSYGQQIAYIAKHTITADLKAGWKGYVLNPRWVLKSGRTDSYGALANWNTLDLTLSKSFKIWKSLSLSAYLSAKNIFNHEYELVSGYPMPGRSFIGGIQLGFN